MKRILMLVFHLLVVVFAVAQEGNYSFISEVYRIRDKNNEETHETYHRIVYNEKTRTLYLSNRAYDVQVYKFIGKVQKETDDKWEYTSVQCEDNDGSKCAMIMRVGINDNENTIFTISYKDIAYDYLITDIE